ncbi:MAG: Spy/CpxP family protein refolding chaperone [Rhodoferax sp.]|nr:Spy/CpxP family protein refolding chaperone [Rhodoferax sp.]
MKLLSKRMLLAGLLASAGFATMAQTPPPPAPAPQAGQAGPTHMERHDPAKWQARMAQHRAKREAELKAKLKLTPAQEGAWTSFTAAMQPPAGMGHMGADRAKMRAEFAKLTTPERIDKMRAMRDQRAADMDKRAEATKTFYAALTPEQQKVFDTATLRMMHREGPKGWHGHHE